MRDIQIEFDLFCHVIYVIPKKIYPLIEEVLKKEEDEKLLKKYKNQRDVCTVDDVITMFQHHNHIDEFTRPEHTRRLIRCASGVLEISPDTQEIQLRPARREEYLVRNIGYDPADVAEVKKDPPNTFLRVIEHASDHDPEVAEYILHWFAYCFTGETHQHKLLFMNGCGGSGKSTLVSIFHILLGDRATSIDSENLNRKNYAPHPTWLADCDDRSAVTTTELAPGHQLHTPLSTR